MNKEEIIEKVQKENVKFVELQFMDIEGMVKTVSISAGNLSRAIEEGIVFDGSSILGYATIDESDLRAHPDLNTFLIMPWTDDEIKTGRMICDIYDSGGNRFKGDPRYILNKTMQKAREMGYHFKTGPEFEFFLFNLDDEGHPTTSPPDSGGYFDLMPLDVAERVRKECTLYFEKMGFSVEASHHEVASGQHEIDLRYGDAMDIADQILTLKYGIKTIAKLNGLHATFMPKPISGVNGTGMHIHQSLFDEDGRNVFYDPSDPEGLSDLARSFVAGILDHARETSSILASWVNSYKRLVPGYEAPVYISWSHLNRSALARIPDGRGKSTRVEVRNPDPAGNPYLQFSALLASGLDGIEKSLSPPSPVNDDLFSMTPEERRSKNIKSLPSNLGNALSEFENSHFLKDVLGEHTHHHFLHVKRKEWEEYRQQVSNWEIKKYLSHL